MTRILNIFFIAFFTIFIADQAIKQIFLNGFSYDNDYFSLILTYNKGVAFSMFAFLGEWLKFIQIALIVAVFIYLIKQRQILFDHAAPIGILLGAGSSNLLDRFTHGGVVDYVFWHKWFEFAIFNFADVMIDLAVILIIWQNLRKKNE